MELWFKERHKNGTELGMRVLETLFRERSRYQDVAVVETEDFGRMLLVDGLVMLTERDEFIYHEMIAHPCLFVHPEPRKVLVIGGGDGGTVREVTKHKNVEEIVLCEIDQLVLDCARRFFPATSNALFSDPRVEIVVKDAFEYIAQVPNSFDCIIVDSSDPVGPAKALFEALFYKGLHSALKDGGIMVMQSESPIYHLDIIRDIKKGLVDAGFSKVFFYWAPVPTYPSGTWSWVFASDCYNPSMDLKESRTLDEMKLKYYNYHIHRASFCLPTFFKEAIRP